MLPRVFGFALLLAAAASAFGQQVYWKKDHIYVNGKEVATVTPLPADQTAPAAPGGLTAPEITATSVRLNWSASSDSGGSGLAGYRIYRQAGATAPLPVGTVAAGVLTFRDDPVTPSTGYTYTVRAFDQAQNLSAASITVSITTLASNTDTSPPSPPVNLTGTALSQTAVNLRWLGATDTGGAGVAGYRVQRGTSVLATLPASALSYQDSTGSQNTTYAYKIFSIDGNNNASTASADVNVTTLPETTPPTTPGNFSGTGLSTTSIRLTWSASADSGGSGLAGYKVYRSGTLVSGTNLITGTTFDNTGLTPNTSYSYTVVAVDGVGNTSAPAGPISVSTLAPPPFSTIVFQDSFDRDDYEWGSGWSYNPFWTTINYQARVTNGVINWQDIFSSPGVSVFQVSADLSYVQWGTSGLAFGSGYRATIYSGSTLNLSRNGDTLASAQIGGANHTLMVEAYNTTGLIKVYADGNLVISYTTGDPSSVAGQAGMTAITGGGYPAFIDNFVVRQ